MLIRKLDSSGAFCGSFVFTDTLLVLLKLLFTLLYPALPTAIFPCILPTYPISQKEYLAFNGSEKERIYEKIYTISLPPLFSMVNNFRFHGMLLFSKEHLAFRGSAFWFVLVALAINSCDG